MKKKKSNPVLRILFILFILYISLYIAGESGYYENQTNNKIVLTDENIAKFEEDVKNNRNIDIKQYSQDNNIDYSNTASKLGDEVSLSLEKFLTEGIGKIGKVIKKMFS